MKIKNSILFFLILLTTTKGFSKLATISIDSSIYNELQKNTISLQVFTKLNDIYIIKLDETYLPYISYLTHTKFKRCGGYILEKDPISAMLTLKQFEPTSFFYRTNQEKNPLIESMISQVDHHKIKQTIENLSSFQNRYYKSNSGVSSQQWIYNTWSRIAGDSDYINVKTYKHSDYRQPSIILTIKGKTLQDEHLILGAHGDSIAGWFPNESTKAPGADDNASGIATLTEAYRLLVQNNYRPDRTIQFISYAAEEVGLRGSNDIAQEYARTKKKIKGVLQFDMTNFSNSPYDLVLINDYTTEELNTYLASLLDIYFPEFKWTYDKCGYACSDHASWYRQGFPVAFPFETTFSTHNSKIHTKHDTLAISKNIATHAAKFAKLALAFLIDASMEK